MLVSFHDRGLNDLGHIVFSLSIVNLNLHYNFWSERDKDLICGMRAPLSNDAKVNDIVCGLNFKTFLDFVAAVSIVFHKHTLFSSM